MDYDLGFLGARRRRRALPTYDVSDVPSLALRKQREEEAKQRYGEEMEQIRRDRIKMESQGIMPMPVTTKGVFTTTTPAVYGTPTARALHVAERIQRVARVRGQAAARRGNRQEVARQRRIAQQAGRARTTLGRRVIRERAQVSRGASRRARIAARTAQQEAQRHARQAATTRRRALASQRRATRIAGRTVQAHPEENARLVALQQYANELKAKVATAKAAVADKRARSAARRARIRGLGQEPDIQTAPYGFPPEPPPLGPELYHQETLVPPPTEPVKTAPIPESVAPIVDPALLQPISALPPPGAPAPKGCTKHPDKPICLFYSLTVQTQQQMFFLIQAIMNMQQQLMQLLRELSQKEPAPAPAPGPTPDYPSPGYPAPTVQNGAWRFGPGGGGRPGLEPFGPGIGPREGGGPSIEPFGPEIGPGEEGGEYVSDQGLEPPMIEETEPQPPKPTPMPTPRLAPRAAPRDSGLEPEEEVQTLPESADIDTVGGEESEREISGDEGESMVP